VDATRYGLGGPALQGRFAPGSRVRPGVGRAGRAHASAVVGNATDGGFETGAGSGVLGIEPQRAPVLRHGSIHASLFEIDVAQHHAVARIARAEAQRRTEVSRGVIVLAELEVYLSQSTVGGGVVGVELERVKEQLAGLAVATAF